MQRKIIVTFEDEITHFAVKNGIIRYVRMAKPCAVGDFNDPFTKMNLAPYTLCRTVAYGVMINNPDGYSLRRCDAQKVQYEHPVYARKNYDDLCNQFECHLSWEEVRSIMDWN